LNVHLSAMKLRPIIRAFLFADVLELRPIVRAFLLAGVLIAPVHAQIPPQAPSNVAPAPATNATQPTEPGSNLTVYLLTFGWGDVVWERFGHNAIWIRDRASGTDITYNWGMFDFNQPHFVWRFVTGDTRYWMEGIDLAGMLRYYKARNRSILSQELNFSPAQRLKLQQFVQWNALPQNKFYRTTTIATTAPRAFEMRSTTHWVASSRQRRSPE